MADTYVTYNLDFTPHSLRGVAGQEIYLGIGNLTGSTTGIVINFPEVVPVLPAYPIEQQIVQLLGLVPLKPCTDYECRSYGAYEYINKVFGHLTDTDVYFNDSNTFMISFPAWYSLAYTTTITLQELVGTVWTDVIDLNDNTYGTYIPYNTYADQPQYMGYIISWRNVLNLHGEGIYRIQFTIVGGHIDACAASEPFCLEEYSCERAANTVKFEITLTNGTVGHATNPAILYDICGLTYTDSIRFEGFFGYERADFERKNVEYNNGIIYKIRDEVVKKFDLQTNRLPKWLHDTFKAYALMADTLLVSDYNYNNPDYSIKRKGIICDGGYEPQWQQFSRWAKVRVTFKENQQNLIRRRCCDMKRPLD